ncbi:MAG: putative adenylyltransferase/sulfurtransferase MoeZ [Syntrophorhabdus sp. PtaU1.Bin050]|nr:MAG: putative adenylyltransferase/sulfurtransferase MoeZ [Syntrophorhabdus sp. PtaU1.Bin050]
MEGKEENGFRVRMFIAAIIFAVICISAPCYAQPAKEAPSAAAKGQVTTIKKLNPKDAYELIQKNKGNPNFVIIDIRTPEEFESGHIEDAANMNYHSDTFVDDLNKLDKDKTYLVYCRTGRRSSDAVSIMARQGFKDIYRIDGDIVKWKAEGLPVIKGIK